MTGFLQAVAYGLLQGGLLALVAVGFSLVWGVMNVVNLSHGAFVVLGAYVGLLVNQHLGLDPFLGMFVAAVALFALGYVVQRFVINLVVNGPIFITLLLTFGLELLLTQGMNIAFTANYQGIQTSYAGTSFAVAGVQIPLGRLVEETRIQLELALPWRNAVGPLDAGHQPLEVRRDEGVLQALGRGGCEARRVCLGYFITWCGERGLAQPEEITKLKRQASEGASDQAKLELLRDRFTDDSLSDSALSEDDGLRQRTKL